MLDLDCSVLVLVDIEEKLTRVMYERDALVSSLCQLTASAKALGLPIIQVEQLPDKMGPTIPELRELLEDVTEPIAKCAFSCVASPEFRDALAATGRRQVLLAGIETHICVYQTAMGLGEDYEVQVVTDAVSSRTAANKVAALARLRQAAAGVLPRHIYMTTVEMAVFEMLHTAEHPAFRDILRIIK